MGMGREWEYNYRLNLGLGMGMGINHWEWERMGLKKIFPIISTMQRTRLEACVMRSALQNVENSIDIGVAGGAWVRCTPRARRREIKIFGLI